MRLIDADALKEKIENLIGYSLSYEAILNAIDNVPTVAFPFEICGNTCQVVRPQGEWRMESKPFGGFGDTVLVITCSVCKTSFFYHDTTPNYCSSCGADMRGKEE